MLQESKTKWARWVLGGSPNRPWSRLRSMEQTDNQSKRLTKRNQLEPLEEEIESLSDTKCTRTQEMVIRRWGMNEW